MSDYNKIITFSPSYDKRNEGKGVSALICTFVLQKDDRAVDFSFNTGIYPEGVENGDAKGWSLGYHSPIPTKYVDDVSHDDCEFTAGDCYSDAGVLASEPFFDALVSQGSKAVWSMLEDYYYETFEKQLHLLF